DLAAIGLLWMYSNQVQLGELLDQCPHQVHRSVRRSMRSWRFRSGCAMDAASRNAQPGAVGGLGNARKRTRSFGAVALGADRANRARGQAAAVKLGLPAAESSQAPEGGE